MNILKEEEELDDGLGFMELEQCSIPLMGFVEESANRAELVDPLVWD